MQASGCGVIRQRHFIAVVVAFLTGCAVVLMAGASGVQAETSKKEEARCEGTSTTKNPAVGTGGGPIPRTTYRAAQRAACSWAPTRMTGCTVRTATTRYVASAVRTLSWEDAATTSSTLGRAMTAYRDR